MPRLLILIPFLLVACVGPDSSSEKDDDDDGGDDGWSDGGTGDPTDDTGVDDGGDDGGDEGDDGGDDGGDEGDEGGDDGSDDGGDDGGDDGDDEPGDSLSDAWEIELGVWGDAIAEDEIGEAGDRDFYTFDVSSGDVVLLSTADYIFEEDAEPDTVMRLYDPDGDLVTTNDDMPHRYWQTDSGIYFQATTTGAYTAEILEYSDWAGDTPVGGSSYDYELWGTSFDPDDVEAEPNDTIALADDRYDDGDYIWYSSFHDPDAISGAQYSDSAAAYASETYGWLDDSSDVDVFVIDMNSSDTSWATLSFWQDMPTIASPVMRLYDSSGTLLAETDDPGFGHQGDWFYDVGILYNIPAGEDRYYVEVESGNGTGGDGSFYQCQLLFYTDSADVEDSSNDSVPTADDLSLTESSSTSDYFYGNAHGTLSTEDTVDYWVINANDANGLQGDYVSVTVQAMSVGSLADTSVFIMDDEGTLLAEASTHPTYGTEDPGILDFEIDDDVDYLIVGVEAESPSWSSEAGQYHWAFRSYSSPIW